MRLPAVKGSIDVLMFTAFAHTVAGQKRQWLGRADNEDRVLERLFPESEGGPAALIAVADGVSRCADGGAVAEWLLHRRLATDLLLQGVPPGPGRCPGVKSYLRGLHSTFGKEFQQRRDLLESACTLAGALMFPDRACVFWSGDSAVHLLRREGERFAGFPLTRPDRIPHTSTLTDCFSGLTSFAVHVKEIDIRPGDILFGATDGLVLDAESLADQLNQHPFSREWIEQLCDLSRSVPGSDDIGIAAVSRDGT